MDISNVQLTHASIQLKIASNIYERPVRVNLHINQTKESLFKCKNCIKQQPPPCSPMSQLLKESNKYFLKLVKTVVKLPPRPLPSVTIYLQLKQHFGWFISCIQTWPHIYFKNVKIGTWLMHIISNIRV